MARLAFFGTPEIAATTLEALLAAGHEVPIVVTNPDRRRSRRGGDTPSPVKLRALAHGIPVAHRPVEALDHGCDLGIVVAYGRLIRPEVLARLRLVNVHFSLLPRWRGAAPVERAILAGDLETGVCLMGLEEGLDTGPVFARAATPISPEEHADTLRARLGTLGIELLLTELERKDLAFSDAVIQQGEVTYAEKIGPEDLELDFSQSAVINHRRVRVGRAWTTFRGRRLLVHEANPILAPGASMAAPSEAKSGVMESGVMESGVMESGVIAPAAFRPGEIVGSLIGTTDGALELVTVQPEGRGRMAFSAWLSGVRLEPGERLGT